MTDYLIGIDLGTTNTVVAYADLHEKLNADNCHIFEIEQLVAPGEVAKRPQLPSFRYHPTQGELSENDVLLPWTNRFAADLSPDICQHVIIGEWARALGAKVEGRQVVSAKSWLSHPQVDRHAPILPWGNSTSNAKNNIPKISPVVASASYLFHVRQAWNVEHPDALMEHQEVIITLPASFDESARALTVEAAKLAGLDKILLLEEPQAVCYDWYARQGDSVQAQLAKLKLLLVCDVGGGTTDLSLIKISANKDQTLSLTRIGVGNHLMLGGDNVDLALAHIVEQKLQNRNSSSHTAPTTKLNAASLSQLIQQTRQAKEILLGPSAPESAKVTLLGSGAKLIGGAKSYDLTKEKVRTLALEGFFPIISINDQPIARRNAMVEFGLPYAPDPAVSKYLAQFVIDHQNACHEALCTDKEKIALPDALLLNGGIFNSPILKGRAESVLNHWRAKEQASPITLLENNNPNLAVAQGAVAYAKARRGTQLKIGGGSARTFFLALEKSEQVQHAICLMPKGTEEEQELTLSERKFSLRLGQPVLFHLLSTTADHPYQAGELITLSDAEFEEQRFISLPPLIVALEKNTAQDNSDSEITVLLAATLTEVGTLKLECVAESKSSTASARWHVEFQVRKNQSNSTSSRTKQSKQYSNDNLPAKFSEVKQLITTAFVNNKKSKAIKTLRIDIEKCIGKRDSWEVPLLRALFDELLSQQNQRVQSSAHERVWLNLTGYCLRPGFGYPADDWRIEQLWPLFKQGLTFDKETQCWIDWWTLWRRAAGGLNVEQQYFLYKEIEKFLSPSALKSRQLQVEAKQKSYEDMVKLVASLEHLPKVDKIGISQGLLKRLEKPTETKTSWWALGRIASRAPFHGSLHNVIDKEPLQSWLPQILKTDWEKQPQIAFAAVLMCRMSGDRERDIDDEWRTRVVTRLKQEKSPASWTEMLETVKELDETETKRVFGEGLPAGLILL